MDIYYGFNERPIKIFHFGYYNDHDPLQHVGYESKIRSVHDEPAALERIVIDDDDLQPP